MKNLLKKSIVSLMLVCSLLPVAPVVTAQDNLDVPAEHAIAVDATTGKILFEKDAETVDAIASLTKILTVYMVYKQIDQGKLSWDTKVKISDYAYELTTNSEASNVPMDKREYTVRELVDAAMIASANSAAIALAEEIGGSEPAFVDMMSAQLKDWGITDAKLVNASGLNNSFLGDNIYPNSKKDDENEMSAKDVAIVSYHMLKDYPEITSVTKKTSETFDNITMATYNYMLNGEPNARDGVDGLKTGTSEKAGASFVGTSTENGIRMIAVVLNADDADTNPYARFVAANTLFDYVKYNYQVTTLTVAGTGFENSKAAVLDGKKKSVPAVAKDDFKVITKIGSEKKPSAKVNTKTVTAQVKPGTTVGSMTYQDPDPIGTGYLEAPPTMTLVAQKEVKKSFFLKVWWNHFVTYVNEKL